MNLKEAQTFAEDIARRAGTLLLKKAGKSKIAVEKKGMDFATDADLASEKMIIAAIQKKFPDCGIIAEESGSCRLGADFCWVIDPLDGTKNFQAGIPFWCVTIALCKKTPLIKGGAPSLRGAGGFEPVVGVTYCPVTDELYSARHGGGARMNGKKIHVSDAQKLAASTVIAGLPGKSGGAKHRAAAEKMGEILKKVWRMRSFGAAAYELALVARGTVDAYIDLSGTTKIWDIAAGILLVHEAGGITLDHTPKNAPTHYRAISAMNPHLKKEVRNIIQ